MGAFDDLPDADTATAPGSGAFDDIPDAKPTSDPARRELNRWVEPSNAGAGRGTGQYRPPAPQAPGVLDRAVTAVKSLADPETYRLSRTPEQDAQTAEEVRKLRGVSVLEDRPTTTPTGPVAPVDPKMAASMKAELGAMPRADRLKANTLLGWKGQTAKALNEQLDAEQGGADSLKMSGASPTLEGRAGHFAANGAGHDTAIALARKDMQRGQTSTTMATATQDAEPSALQSALDSTNRKPLDQTAGGAALETAGDAARGIVRAGQGLAADAWSGVRAASDMTLGPDSDLSQVAKGAADIAHQDQARIQSPDQNSITQQVFESTFTNVPVMLTFGFGSKALAAMGAQSAAQSYGEARDAGHTVEDSAERGVWHGVAEVLGEKFSLPVLGNLFSKAVSNVSTKAMGKVLAELLVKEQVGEQVTTALQDGYDKLGKGGTRPDMTLSDYLDDAVNTAKVTLGQSMLMGGAAHVVHTATSTDGGGQQARIPTAMEMAKARGFLVDPPLTTDTPSKQRAKLGGMFQDLGAKYGLPKDAMDAAIAAADGKPLSQLGSFFQKAAVAFQNRGMFAEPVHPEVMGVFDGPHDPDAQQAEPQQDLPATELEDAGQVDDGAVPELAQGSLASAIEAEQPGAFDDVPTAVAAQIDEAAHQAATSPRNERPEPTAAQKEAGNYAKGHLSLHGMDIAIENPAGSTRSGVSPEGVEWTSTMQHHYGYIKGTMGNDKDHVDTFIGQNPESTHAFVVDQIDPKTGKFDEHKVVLGADSEEQAREIYLSNYAKDWQGLGAITQVPMGAFKSWVRDGAKKQPLGDIPASAKPQARKVERADFAAPEQPQSVGGKLIADMQTGQLLRLSKMAGASERVHQVAAAEIKRREVEHVYGQQEKARAAEEESILAKSRDEMITQAVATSEAGELEAPSAMAAAFKAALAKPGKAKPEPVAMVETTIKPEAPAALPEESAAAFKFEHKKDGTVTVLGDPAAIKAALPDFKGVVGKRGMTYGRSAAKAVVEVLTPKPPPGPTERLFKSRKSAETARNGHGNTLRLQKVKGGYRLREKSAAEQEAETVAAANLKRGARTNVQTDSLLAAIAKAGGLAMAEKADTVGEGNKNVGGKMLFTANGMPIERMVQALAEDGYIPPMELESDGGVSWLQSAIGEEFGGHAKHFSHSGEDWMRQRAEAERGDAPDYEAAGIPDSVLDATGYFDDNAAEQAARDALAAAFFEAQASTDEHAVEAFWQSLDAIESQEEDHARQTQDRTDAEDDAGTGSREGPLAGEPEEGYRSASRDDRQGAAQEGLTLTSPTPASLAADEGTRKAAADADRKRQKKIDDKATADAQVGEFTLTGSDRPADLAAAAGQDDIFDRPAFARRSWYHSELERQIERSPMKAGTAGAWGQYLKSLTSKGVKADEIAWTGIQEWLGLQPGKVSKEQIAEYLGSNGVQVEETVLGGSKYREFADRMHAKYGDAWLDDMTPDELKEKDRLFDQDDSPPTKYSKYTLPGGKNYRELLLTLPTKNDMPPGFSAFQTDSGGWGVQFPSGARLDGWATREAAVASQGKQADSPTYKSSHFDQPNILAHVRIDERTYLDGKRVLFVHEVQSDWGQEGKKKGIASAKPWEVFNPATREIYGTFDSSDEAKKFGASGGFESWDFAKTEGVPAAPFIGKTEAWAGLAIKRLIAYAVDHGFERIAFITGRQAADLYDLSKQVSSVTIGQMKDGTWAVSARTLQAGNPVEHKGLKSIEEVAGVVGKELADKAKDFGPGEYRQFRDVDLKVGGEGMRTFYDQIIPNIAKDVAKKLGGTTSHFGEGTGRQVTIEITPEIRVKVEGGVPLFSRNGESGSSAAPGAGQVGVAGGVRGNAAHVTISKEDITRVVDTFLKKAKAIGIDDVVVVDDARDLPAELKAAAQGQDASLHEVMGVAHRGKVYLVRNRIFNAEHAEQILFHEVYGHLGLRAVVGSKSLSTLNAVWRDINGLAGVKKIASKYTLANGQTIWDRLDSYVDGTRGLPAEQRQSVIIDELIAHLAEANDTSALARFKGYLSDVKQSVVSLLRKLGLDKLAGRLEKTGSEMDVLALVRDARNAIVTGETKSGTKAMLVRKPRYGGAVPAFSRSGEEGRPPNRRVSGADAEASKERSGSSSLRGAHSVSLDKAGKAAFLQGEPVAVLQGDEAPHGYPALREWATKKFADAGGKATNPELGAVVLDARAVRDSMSHGMNPFKAVAFAAVPQVIERGVVVLSAAHDRDVTSHFVSAPVRIKGVDDVVTVLIRKDPNTQRMYLHSVITKENLLKARDSGTDTASDVERSGKVTSGDVASVLRELLAFNPPKNGAETDQGPLFALKSSNAKRFNLPEFGKAEFTVEQFQNRYNRWKQTTEAVRTQGGKVTEQNDFYQAEERYWGIVGHQLEDFQGEVEDLIKAVQADKLELSDVALYAYARHAPERNAQIAKINPKFPDGGSGMTDAEAAAILAKAKQDGNDQALAKHAAVLTAWTAGTRKVLLDHGLISQEEHDAWASPYSNYVPLRGHVDAEGGRKGTGAGFDVRGKESIRAMGRKSKASNIVEYILQDRAKALIRSGKNDVMRRFAKFVLDNPDTTLWEINKIEKARRIAKTPTGEEVVDTESINTAPANTVAMKDGGQTIYITVKDEALLAQLKNLNAQVGPNPVLSALLTTNRYLSTVYTTLSPAFMMTNGARDILAGTVNMIGVGGFGAAGKMLSNLPMSYAASFMGEAKGKPSPLYREYMTNGGKTGFMDHKDIEGYAKQLGNIQGETVGWLNVWDGTKGGWAKSKAVGRRAVGAGKTALGYIETANEVVENATRFAAYKAARESGKSVAQASSIAKNITVNFNRRGAASWPGAMFLFYNPAVQGSARMVQALKSPKVQAAVGAGMVGVAMLALANASMGGDDDDGQAYWDKIPDEVKERNLIIMLAPGSEEGEAIPGTKHGRFIKIPLAYGYNTFAVIANTAVDILRNRSNPLAGVTAGKGAARVAKAFIGSWIPVSDAAPAIDNPKAWPMAFVPDALDPIFEPLANVNGFGRQMYPDGMGMDKVPDSEKVFPGQRGTWSQGAARWLNEAGGGDAYREGGPFGLLSMTPATIDGLVKGYGGGVAGFTSQIADAFVTHGVNREATEWWRLPFVRQLYGEVDLAQDQAIAYDRLNAVESVTAPMNRAKKAGDREAVAAIKAESGSMATLGDEAKAMRQSMTEIRKNEIRVIESDKYTDAQKNAALRNWNHKRQQAVDKFNKSVNRATVRDRESESRD